VGSGGRAISLSFVVIVILADTSVWVDHLRGRRTKAAGRLADLFDGGLATTDVVVMEILAGARDGAHLTTLRRLLQRCEHLPVLPADYEAASAIWRTCRRGGDTPRSLLDCLVAAVAIRRGVAVLHSDRDYEVIARHAGLAIDR
jgi:predicted nucleic acid-binding protein